MNKTQYAITKWMLNMGANPITWAKAVGIDATIVLKVQQTVDYKQFRADPMAGLFNSMFGM